MSEHKAENITSLKAPLKVRVKEFVQVHKTKILATTAAVATTVAVVERVGLKQHDDFLRDEDLYEKFYGIDNDTDAPEA